MTLALSDRRRSPTTQCFPMTDKCIKQQGLGEDIGNIVMRANREHQDGCRRQLGTKSMILDSQQLGAWCHVRKICSCESQGRHVILSVLEKPPHDEEILPFEWFGNIISAHVFIVAFAKTPVLHGMYLVDG